MEAPITQFVVKQTSFEEILPFWECLWPKRSSPIKPTSSLLFLGGHDLRIHNEGNPHFWKLLLNDTVIGVNSGLSTSQDAFRSRGLWIHPQFRGKSLSQKLLHYAEIEGIKRGCKYLWSAPRYGSLTAYEKFGFVQVSAWIDRGFEFGPNCYARKDL